MHIVMFDRQPIFIQGVITHLHGITPAWHIEGTSQTDELWSLLSSIPSGIVIVDGEMNHEYCLWLLEEIGSRFPDISKVVVLNRKNSEWIEQLIQRNVLAIIPRNASADMYTSILQMVSLGMACIPGKWLKSSASGQQGLSCLSERQMDVLKLLADGESNKAIGRALNISAATVKAHLEALFRRLDVKSRTQAALLYSRVA
ncbi:response regulator transcription factor [Huaxiibacter chinensis]